MLIISSEAAIIVIMAKRARCIVGRVLLLG